MSIGTFVAITPDDTDELHEIKKVISLAQDEAHLNDSLKLTFCHLWKSVLVRSFPSVDWRRLKMMNSMKDLRSGKLNMKLLRLVIPTHLSHLRCLEWVATTGELWTKFIKHYIFRHLFKTRNLRKKFLPAWCIRSGRWRASLFCLIPPFSKVLRRKCSQLFLQFR